MGFFANCAVALGAVAVVGWAMALAGAAFARGALWAAGCNWAAGCARCAAALLRLGVLSVGFVLASEGWGAIFCVSKLPFFVGALGNGMGLALRWWVV